MTYDFGDTWRHRVVVEKVLAAQDGATCTGGRRACPPEDCGGVWGYEEMLAALADPEHEDHEQMLEWVGPDWDAAEFSVQWTDAALRSLG